MQESTIIIILLILFIGYYIYNEDDDDNDNKPIIIRQKEYVPFHQPVSRPWNRGWAGGHNRRNFYNRRERPFRKRRGRRMLDPRGPP
tara:strand:- start:209 stop:469 length:261 start_codon:yes stop_codon:yes gene_type:complete